MLVYSVSVIVVAMMVFAHPVASHAEQFGDGARGRVLVGDMCSECHAVGNDDAMSPDPEAPPLKDVAMMASTTRTALTVWFRSPHPTMPDLVLGRQDTDDVIAYILSLKPRP